jgi:hypothetical protein
MTTRPGSGASDDMTISLYRYSEFTWHHALTDMPTRYRLLLPEPSIALHGLQFGNRLLWEALNVFLRDIASLAPVPPQAEIRDLV